jgi:hypothetical protein
MVSKTLKKLKILLASGEGWKGGPLTTDEFKQHINNDFSEAYNQYLKGHTIYRGDRGSFDIQYIIPGNRKSQNTHNHYTELFSNILESWKDFPKRNHSIICTNSLSYAKHYRSNIYKVFPKNGTKLGICSANDIWDSFRVFLEPMIKCDLDFDLSMFNSIVDTIMYKYGYEDINTFISDFKNKNKKEMPRTDAFNTLYNLLYDNKDNLYNFLNNGFDPYKNGLKLININDYSSVPHDREVWFDGECIFVNNYFNDNDIF